MKKYNYQTLIKLLFLFLLTILFSFCNAKKEVSKYKPIEIKEIVFKKSTTNDKDLLSKSMKDFNEKLIVELKNSITEEIKEQNQDSNLEEINQKIDSLNPFLEMVSSELFISNNEFNHFRFQDSLIVSYVTINNKIHGDYRIINRNKNTFHYLAKIDSTTTYYNYTPYKYRDEKGLIINEFRNEKKIIQGIECFKIVVRAQDDIGNEEMPDFFQNLTTEYTMYVTERIKCSFHPVVWYKIILDKYYPLEIEESNEVLKGSVIKYELEKLVLNDY
ncbi:hypothetical protein M0M57_04340 [Flavobacterium azooxidireducens]|uniref:DUF4377 domain-containing protein n=1 Tax=Flavobacterium azooxidireducens TaxID=1871076 RepID=A0ABY4KIG8_9FLAO|nr:hypothetical protein [Flavobacterium azooxidireducens]UPQ80066.1 hypothetical protein M0M57_04340 [Flavobacterium azooxidireducens]